MAMKLDFNLAKPPSCSLNPDHIHNVTFDWETGQLRRMDEAICTCACEHIMWELSDHDRILLRSGMEAWELVTEDERAAFEQEESSTEYESDDSTDNEVEENDIEDNDTDSVDGSDEEEGSRMPVRAQVSAPRSVQSPSVSSIRVPKRAREDETTEDHRSKKARQSTSEREASWSYIEYQENALEERLNVQLAETTVTPQSNTF
ncbi:hypothetical protein K435DRAFT_804523 [Dendrothele bispora CBS 962.96]|uniref:Uncharacterized protein n=1 Tax=Dendrothele bispora (strain CBS 962.96) TaxID=1314807 RepID=A0A4S8LET3_DENBC|nr:hypothetical protein K435DRAFT_804523 [Dendrothele bispora CBS 962.96]